MAASVRELRAKIRSTQATKKITRAMELIAASRIIKAQQHAAAAAPYARELTRAVSAVATFSNVDHPLTTEKENPTRAAVLVITSDRGLAGSYSSSVLKEAERLTEKLRSEGKEVDFYLSGRKAVTYFTFRQREFVQSWTGYSDKPEFANAREIGDALTSLFAEDETSEEAIDPARAARAAHRVHALQVDAHAGAGRHPPAPARGRRGHGDAGRVRAAPAVRVRAVGARGARRAAAEVREQPHLLLPAAGSGL